MVSRIGEVSDGDEVLIERPSDFLFVAKGDFVVQVTATGQAPSAPRAVQWTVDGGFQSRKDYVVDTAGAIDILDEFDQVVALTRPHEFGVTVVLAGRVIHNHQFRVKGQRRW